MKQTTTLLNTSNIDLLIIGGGILGVAIAALAALRRYNVVLLRLSDEERPQAETLRNQSWLQSGIMYVDKFKGNRNARLKLAKKMYAWGRTMLRRLSILIPEESGSILRVRDPTAARQLLRDANDLKISKFVRQLEESEGRTRLERLYEEPSLYFTLPDIPFDEAAALTTLRQNAVEDGALLLNTQTPARLVRDSSVTGGFRCEWEGGTLTSRVTVAAAGVGNYPLLEQLGVPPPMSFRQTPLLVVRDELSVHASIYADRTRGFSFVRQPFNTNSNAAKLVVGTKVHRDVPFRTAKERYICEEDVEAFKKCLPPVLKACMPDGRFTAGYEVIPDDSTRKSHLEDWVQPIDGFPNLILASPGRATLGLMTAQQVVNRVARLLGGPGAGGGTGAPPSAPKIWDEDIHMHFEDYYSFDDSRWDE